MSTRLRLATPADDTLLRQLLHDNPMPGWVEMALTREPSYFASHGWFGQDWAVLAEDGPPDAPSCVGMYSASVQPLHLNGQPVALGYLGGLRVQSQERRRIRHLRAGYASIRALVPPGPLQPQRPWWLTVVEAGNAPARRLLEAGVAGLPRYLPLGEASTYALPTARGRAPKRPEAALWRPATAQELPTLLAWQREQARAWQFSPVLDAQLLHRIGLHHTWVHETDGAYQAFAVLWDQRAFKQVMALRYHARIAWALGGYNRLARWLRRVPLPEPGQALAQCHLSFFTLGETLRTRPAAAQRPRLTALLAELLARCPTPVATLGALAAAHPLAAVLPAFRPFIYRGGFYAVAFDAEGERAATELDGRPLHAEAALL